MRRRGSGSADGGEKNIQLTEVTQDGADEGQLGGTKLAFHERNDL